MRRVSQTAARRMSSWISTQDRKPGAIGQHVSSFRDGFAVRLLRSIADYRSVSSSSIELGLQISVPCMTERRVSGDVQLIFLRDVGAILHRPLEPPLMQLDHGIAESSVCTGLQSCSVFLGILALTESNSRNRHLNGKCCRTAVRHLEVTTVLGEKRTSTAVRRCDNDSV
jgi:hypothetical protein